jgi:hypothetical protein
MKRMMTNDARLSLRSSEGFQCLILWRGEEGEEGEEEEEGRTVEVFLARENMRWKKRRKGQKQKTKKQKNKKWRRKNL